MAQKSQSGRDPRFDRRSMQWQDMTRSQQRLSETLMRQHGAEMKGKLEAGAASLETQAAKGGASAKTKRTKGERMARAAAAFPRHGLDISLESAAQRRVAAVTTSATTHRMPSEPVGGLGWYFDAAGKITEAAPNLAPRVRTSASAALSPGTRPEDERASLAALARAHGDKSATVQFHPKLVKALGRGAVPKAMHGQSVHVSEVPAGALAAMATGKHRALVAKHAPGVDWESIGKASVPANIAKAARVVRGEIDPDVAQAPRSNPKTHSYRENLVQASEADERVKGEYMLRGSHLGRVLRGEEARGQGMLDLYGQRRSQEGILSSTNVTAEDSWMRAISGGHPDPQLRKSIGDISLGRKTGRIWRWGTGEIVKESVSRDPGISGESVQHAWENRATQMAAERLRTQQKLEFNVPAVMVQETAWTGIRRSSPPLKVKSGGMGADPEYNASVRAAQPPKQPRQRKQPELFTASGAPTRQAMPSKKHRPPTINSKQFGNQGSLL